MIGPNQPAPNTTWPPRPQITPASNTLQFGNVTVTQPLNTTRPVTASTITQAALPTYNPAYPPAIRPTGQITSDNYGEWVAYWNYEATKPYSARIPAPPQVMTRDQIWEMKKRKAVARREALAAEQASQFTPVFVGSAVQNLALRTG